jgi:phosphatidylglycerophosphate synthase
LISGLAAAGCFAVGEELWNWAGAVSFIISMVLDRADGELARLSGKSSRFGAIYDLVVDSICNSAVFIGIGIAATDSFLGNWAIMLGIIAGICISIIFYTIIRVAADVDASAASFNARAGFDPDDAMILVPLGILFGLGNLLLILAAAITPLVAIYIGNDMYQRRKRACTGPV